MSKYNLYEEKLQKIYKRSLMSAWQSVCLLKNLLWVFFLLKFCLIATRFGNTIRAWYGHADHEPVPIWYKDNVATFNLIDLLDILQLDMIPKFHCQI